MSSTNHVPTLEVPVADASHRGSVRAFAVPSTHLALLRLSVETLFPSDQLQEENWSYSAENQLLAFACDHTRALSDEHTVATDPIGLAAISFGPSRNQFALMRMRVTNEDLFWRQARRCMRGCYLQPVPITAGWRLSSPTWDDALSAVSAEEYERELGQRERYVGLYFTIIVLPRLVDVARSLPALGGSSQETI